MNLLIRLGNINDLETVVHGDQHVKGKILEWKLMNEEIILAELKEEIIGYLRLEYLWSIFPYIGLIIVNPEYRNRGVGRTMLKYLEERLLDTGHNVLYSSSQVNESDPQEWHRRMGFKECGIINGINEGNIGEVFFSKGL